MPGAGAASFKSQLERAKRRLLRSEAHFSWQIIFIPLGAIGALVLQPEIDQAKHRMQGKHVP